MASGSSLDDCSEEHVAGDDSTSSSSSSSSSDSETSSDSEEMLDQPSTIKQGPTSLQDAFGWPEWNTRTLFEDPCLRKSFEELVRDRNIEVHECFAGTCAGSVALKQQFRSMSSACGMPSDTNSVVTKTSCEWNTSAQTFLLNLNEAGQRLLCAMLQAVLC